MTSCLACSTPNPEEFLFCTSCGWPRKQPSPYGGEAKNLPVGPVADSPARDGIGRPLSYDPDPRSGRAYIPGAVPGAIDKIPDYPSAEGPGNRRSGDIQAGTGKTGGADHEGGMPVGAAFGAGRFLWADSEHLFVWDLATFQLVRLSLANLTLSAGRDTVLANGWKTYIRAERGLAVHDGMSGNLTILAAEKFSAIAVDQGKLAAATENTVVFFGDRGEQATSKVPFAVASLVSFGSTLAAFGEQGQLATWNGTTWVAVGGSGEAGSTFAQGWIVNGHIGIRTVNAGFSQVRYVNASTGEMDSTPFAVATDGPVSVIPGRTSFEQHRLLGFVGGSDPQINIYHPSESGSMKDRRPISLATLGTTVATVRRSGTESAIVAATVDTSERKVEFNFLRDDSKPLPSPLFQPPRTSHSWLVPHLEGLIVLSFDGKRSVVNNIPYPV